MACRRMVTKKGILFPRSYHSSLSHVVHRGDRSDENFQSPYPSPLSQLGCGISNIVLSQIHNGSNIGGNGGFRTQFGWNRWYPAVMLPARIGLSLSRNISSGTGEGFDHAQNHGDNISSILTNENMEAVSSQVPGYNEVAVAAADSAFPVAALQHLIDGVQTLTGLNWWASIAITTILIRGAVLPFTINMRKADYQRRLLELRSEMLKKNSHLGKDFTSEFQKELNFIWKQYGVGPNTLAKLLLIQGSILTCFFFAISNMVEKVPSLKNGGAFWFTDLTTPDSLYICPVLTALLALAIIEISFKGRLSAVEFETQRISAIFTVLFTMGLPKAYFCYLIASQLFVLSCVPAFKRPEVRKLFDLPIAPAPKSPPHKSTSQSQSESSSDSEIQQHNTKKEPKQPHEP